MQSHSDIIEAFGGQTRIAIVLGLPKARTSHWKERGIPLKYRRAIEKTDLAREYGITADLLDSLPVNTKGTDQ